MQLSETLRDALTVAGAKVRVGYPRWLRPFVAGNVVAITLGRRIYVASRYAQIADDAMERLIRHELAHVRQVNRYTLPLFLVRYGWDFLRLWAKHRSVDAAYHSIPFEIEARRAEEAENETGL